ncbi:ras association domain-containing protein 5 isoform X3 [Syngnathoides biaculeatus]|uniref:ras association domain-containing protein 5 isoform X3 n=1 Tax=Syngnathoides biaculeatus TaxID=300417 RepID=UPI002ADE0320|nr:ras association domain-containing protein 5 isoform X3 [Syngnathoides biaculeatus]
MPSRWCPHAPPMAQITPGQDGGGRETGVDSRSRNVGGVTVSRTFLGQVSLRLEEVRGDSEAEVSSACFGQVSRRLGRLLKRLPKSRSWSDGLRILRRSPSNGSLLPTSDCTYTCHLECERQVQLDCNQRDNVPEETLFPRPHRSTGEHKKSEAKAEEAGGVKDLPDEEVSKRIEEYNSRVSENGMKLASDGSYTGFIEVHLRLSRPVTVPAVEVQVPRGPGGSQSQGQDRGQGEDRTSSYLPCDCVKQLHISSTTTTREVIQGLLKFMVLDNPCKFALYKQTHRDGQDLFQKLPLCERPLLLRLIAGPDPEQLSFVLKENETGEVEWHAFSVPELQNFLVILDKEEAERVRAVESKYTMYRRKLQQALQQHDP